MRGKFITFEGIDGAGKSSHIERFAERLRARGIGTMVTREPGGTPLAERLREILLNVNMQPQTEVLLAFAARAEHLFDLIEPALNRNDWVICDRFSDSTYAYQGGGRGVEWSLIQSLESAVQKNLQPDLTIWFDLPEQQAAARRAKARQADRFEAEDVDFFERVRYAYQRRQRENSSRFRTVDASQSLDEIRALLDKIALTI